MNVVFLMMRRTTASVRELRSTGIAVFAFLSATSAVLIHLLYAHDGIATSFPAIWAGAVAPVLPVLAALFGMDVWSGEYRSGRIDLLLSASVREFDLSLGKFLGVFRLVVGALLLSLLSSFFVCRLYCGSAVPGLLSFLPAFTVLLVQGVLWCAVTTICSSLTAHGAAAAAFSVLFSVALPRGIWLGVLAWSPLGRSAWGEFPLDAHVSDAASGLFEPGVIGVYLILSLALVFVSSRFVFARRLVGGAQLRRRLSNRLIVFLSSACTVVAIALLAESPVAIEIPVSGSAESLSIRTRNILSESYVTMRMTLMMSRKNASFRSIARLMRLFRRSGEAQAGLRLELRYVDPDWDVAESARLVRLGAEAGSIVLERGRLSILVPNVSERSERELASAIQQLTAPARRRSVCWTRGHGESDFTRYDSLGVSDIAREMSRDGFVNVPIDLQTDAQIPADCAFIVIAGARNDFSRSEIKRLTGYLQEGGRLLVLADEAASGGVQSLLSAWGVRLLDAPQAPIPSMGPGELVFSDFSRHSVVSSLAGRRVVLDRPLALSASAMAVAGSGADKLEFSPLVTSGQTVVAAAVERGTGAGGDLSIRPTRLVVVGDSDFILNGRLSAYGCANREFFLNAATYLAGVDSVLTSDSKTGLLSVGLDRAGYLRMTAVSAFVVPFGIFVMMFLFRRRRRSRR